MKILILGGTRFVGLHIVEAALAAGHQVTLFNRGQSNLGFYPQLELLRGKCLTRLLRDPSPTVLGMTPKHVISSDRTE